MHYWLYFLLYLLLSYFYINLELLIYNKGLISLFLSYQTLQYILENYAKKSF